MVDVGEMMGLKQPGVNQTIVCKRRKVEGWRCKGSCWVLLGAPRHLSSATSH